MTRNRWIALASLVIFGISIQLRGADKDAEKAAGAVSTPEAEKASADAEKISEIELAVDKAREKYQGEINLIREQMLKLFDERETKERQRGVPDLNKIKIIKGEREEFELSGTIPKWAIAKFSARAKRAKATFGSALNAAKKDLVRIGADDAADNLGRESEQIAADGVPPYVPAEPTSAGAEWQDWGPNAPPPGKVPFPRPVALKRQVTWAKFLKTPVEFTNTIGMKFRVLPPGEMMMGTSPTLITEFLKTEGNVTFIQECIQSEGPAHRVVLTRPIYFGVHEVTQGQYKAVTGTNPAFYTAQGEGKDTVKGADTSRFPIEQVSWNAAVDFCIKLSLMEKRQPCYERISTSEVNFVEGTGYRLLTEAEWEFGCRGGTQTNYWMGDDVQRFSKLAQLEFKLVSPHPVSELDPNPFGFYDLHGNVYEWVQDAWAATWYADSKEANPCCPITGTEQRVARGGRAARSARRGRGTNNGTAPNVGFRVALVIPPKVDKGEK